MMVLDWQSAGWMFPLCCPSELAAGRVADGSGLNCCCCYYCWLVRQEVFPEYTSLRVDVELWSDDAGDDDWVFDGDDDWWID